MIKNRFFAADAPLLHAKRPLMAHPACQTDADDFIVHATVFYEDSALIVDYEVRDRKNHLRLPAPTTPSFADNLWQHSCCELFIASADTQTKNYQEFNFSPSGKWAVYDFLNYRLRNENYQAIGAPQIKCHRHATGFNLRAFLPTSLFSDTFIKTACRVNLSVVLENQQGGLFYYALSHPSPQPDFHHPSGFVTTVR